MADVGASIYRIYLRVTAAGPQQPSRRGCFIQDAKPGIIHGRLVDCGPYPALLRDAEAKTAGACVRGLWVVVNEQGLKQMDELEQFHGIDEDNDYDRVWVEDTQAAGLQGWVYVWDEARGRPSIAEAYWPDYFSRKLKS